LTILDSDAVLAYLKDEVAAPEVEGLIAIGGRGADRRRGGEVLDHLIRIGGANEEDASLDVAQLGLDDPVPMDGTLGAASGRPRARHYHRVRCSVSLADCFAAEVARSQTRSLATSDPPLLEVCHAEGIGAIVLAGSDGSRWTASP
jgi:hypothetical protein